MDFRGFKENASVPFRDKRIQSKFVAERHSGQASNTYKIVTVSMGSSLSSLVFLCKKRRSGGLIGVRGAMYS